MQMPAVLLVDVKVATLELARLALKVTLSELIRKFWDQRPQAPTESLVCNWDLLFLAMMLEAIKIIIKNYCTNFHGVTYRNACW